MSTNKDYRHVENVQETMIKKFEALTEGDQAEMIIRLRRIATIDTFDREQEENWKRYSNSPK
jgi:hypothetical protein